MRGDINPLCHVIFATYKETVVLPANQGSRQGADGREYGVLAELLHCFESKFLNYKIRRMVVSFY